MRLQVSLEVAALGEGPAAAESWAEIRSFPSMASSVDLEGVGAHEVGPTDGADIGSRRRGRIVPVVGVASCVVFQVPQSGETLTTSGVVTFVGLLSCMNAQVGVQVPLLCKSLLAGRVRAHERPFSRLFRSQSPVREFFREFGVFPPSSSACRKSRRRSASRQCERGSGSSGALWSRTSCRTQGTRRRRVFPPSRGGYHFEKVRGFGCVFLNCLIHGKLSCSSGRGRRGGAAISNLQPCLPALRSRSARLV